MPDIVVGPQLRAAVARQRFQPPDARQRQILAVLPQRSPVPPPGPGSAAGRRRRRPAAPVRHPARPAASGAPPCGRVCSPARRLGTGPAPRDPAASDDRPPGRRRNTPRRRWRRPPPARPRGRTGRPPGTRAARRRDRSAGGRARWRRDPWDPAPAVPVAARSDRRRSSPAAGSWPARSAAPADPHQRSSGSRSRRHRGCAPARSRSGRRGSAPGSWCPEAARAATGCDRSDACP